MSWTPLTRFWNLLKVYRIELRQIYVYAIFAGLVNLSLPVGIQAIINFLQSGELTSTWILLVVIVLIGIALAGILQVFQLRVVENIQQDLFARSAFEFSFRLPKISFVQLDKVHAPELVNRFFDTLSVQKGLPKILIDFPLAAFQIIFGLLVLTFYSPIFIFLGVGLALLVFLLIRLTGPKGLETSLGESKQKYRLAHWLEEVARVNRSLKVNGDPNFHMDKTDDIVVDYLKERRGHFSVLINQFIIFVGFKVILAAGLLLLGGLLVFREEMNIGQFVAAEIIIILILNSIEKIIRTIDTIYDVLTSLEKIGVVTDLKLDNGIGKKLIHEPGGFHVRASEIEFGFPDEKKKIIENLSFEIQVNETIVLKGPSGSGKTVLLQILGGIHELDKGELYFDGVPIGNYQREPFYQAVGVNFATNQIFEGSIRENILLGRKVDESLLTETIDVLRLNTYLNTQPYGLESVVDSGGRRLPRSVIQKIQLARIIINKPKLLLMENPLQFVEERERSAIIDYLMAKERNWTVVVVSDHPHWTDCCSRVLEMK